MQKDLHDQKDDYVVAIWVDHNKREFNGTARSLSSSPHWKLDQKTGEYFTAGSKRLNVTVDNLTKQQAAFEKQKQFQTLEHRGYKKSKNLGEDALLIVDANDNLYEVDLEQLKKSQAQGHFDPENNSVWGTMNRATPSFAQFGPLPEKHIRDAFRNIARSYPGTGTRVLGSDGRESADRHYAALKRHGVLKPVDDRVKKNEAFSRNGLTLVNEREGSYADDAGRPFVTSWECGKDVRFRRYGQGTGSADTQFWKALEKRYEAGERRIQLIQYTEDVSGKKSYDPNLVDAVIVAFNNEVLVIKLV